jgi:hypothetical protein
MDQSKFADLEETMRMLYDHGSVQQTQQKSEQAS